MNAFPGNAFPADAFTAKLPANFGHHLMSFLRHVDRHVRSQTLNGLLSVLSTLIAAIKYLMEIAGQDLQFRICSSWPEFTNFRRSFNMFHHVFSSKKSGARSACTRGDPSRSIGRKTQLAKNVMMKCVRFSPVFDEY